MVIFTHLLSQAFPAFDAPTACFGAEASGLLWKIINGWLLILIATE
jgi:hypothetical protein